MRKHLYLITEHDNVEMVGQMKFTDNQLARPEKNEEGPIQVYDKEGFSKIGQQVYLGYYDFEDTEAAQDPDRVREVMHTKLAEIDVDHVEKAGLEVEEVTA